MRVLWLLVGLVGLVLVPRTESTFGLLGAAPAIAAVGGLSAVKILKVIGLAAVKNQLTNGISNVFNNEDEYDDYYSREPSYLAPPVLSQGPPSFYIVPSDYFDRRRGKRDTQGKNKQAQTVGEIDYFNVIATLDTDGCAQRLVCELAQKSEEEIKEDERAIMFSFKTSVAPPPSTIRNSKGIFDYAAWLGKNSVHNSKACEAFYSQCTSNSQEIMEAFRLMEAKEVVGDSNFSQE
ncbi:uncharacterized protein [Palaemon carinicauda]|uniref:uncharacterized protein n=1 Tax=Palaemon carinicauda TaxID=392227 RepID=UPI0035B5C639